jgi:hypothetical protein
VLDNRRSAKVALRNADYLSVKGVDLIVEFQVDEAWPRRFSARYQEAGIPVHPVHVPHPRHLLRREQLIRRACCGHYFGRWVKSRWNGQVDEVILLDAQRPGPLVHGRMAGVVAGLKETMRETMAQCPVITLDGDGVFKASLERVRRHLQQARSKYVLVGRRERLERARRGAGVSGGRARVDVRESSVRTPSPTRVAEMREPRTPAASVGRIFSRARTARASSVWRSTSWRGGPRRRRFSSAPDDHGVKSRSFYPNDALMMGPAGPRPRA